MDKKDLHITIAELLKNYQGDEIVEALNNIYELNVAENCMGQDITIKQFKLGKEINDAFSKKKSNNSRRSDK